MTQLGSRQEIKTADIITSIDKIPVKSMSDVIYYVSEKNVEDEILLTINRDGKLIELQVILGARSSV